MTLGNERETWREAVRAFRLAATALKDPAPALFADLSVEEGLRDLTQEPPLVSFSPFDALPDGGLAGPDEQAYLSRSNSGSGRAFDPVTPPRILPDVSSPISDRSGSGRDLDLATGHGTTPTLAGWPRTSGSRSPWDLLGAAPPQDNELAVQPPVFSFRRSDPATQRRSSQSNQDMRGSSAEEDENALHTGHPRVPGPTPEDRRWGAPADVDARLDLPDMVPPGAAIDDHDAVPDDHTPGERSSHHSMALLNRLTDGFLKAERGRGPDLPLSGPGDLPLEDVYRTELGGNLPELDLEAYGNGAIALIGSLAEHLLSLQVKTVGDSSGPGENTLGVAAPTVSGAAGYPEEATALDRSPFAFSESAHGWPTGGSMFGPKPSDMDKEEVPGVAPDQYMDAETFASLVNDVLVEQARRHGVNLS